jgi:phage portal protein BeeE
MRASSVYAAVTLIAETLGSLPVKIIERGDRERRPQRPDAARVMGRAGWRAVAA